MGCFEAFLRHGRYLKTLSKGYSQKGLDSIKRIVSDLISEGDFSIKRLFESLTLSKGYSDSIKRIVENCLLAKENPSSRPFYTHNKAL